MPATTHPTDTASTCRPGCGACCTAPSITSAIPGMPLGKPAGVACVQLDESLRCRLFGQPSRPAVCAGLAQQPRAGHAMAGLDGAADGAHAAGLIGCDGWR